MLLYLAVGIFGSYTIFVIGDRLEARCPQAMRVCGLVGRQTLPILCLHMFLYMFLQTGAGVLGLGDGLTKTVMVVGSLVALTVAGVACHYIIKWLDGRRNDN